MHIFSENSFWLLLLKASWQAAVLIVVVLAMQWFLGGRLAPRWRFRLWLLVALRLALPWTVPSALSLFNLLKFSSVSAVTDTLKVVPDLPDSAVAQLAQPAPRQPSSQSAMVSSEAAASTFSVAHAWLPLAWSAGASAVLLGLVVNHIRFHRNVAANRPLIEETALNLLEDCKERMGIRAPVTLVETAAVAGPALFGFLRPRILLPPEFTRSFSREELRFVFLHELGHVKRHDILLGWLMAVLQVLHWFNPLVWLAFGRMRVDRELACDALALSYTDDHEYKTYGLTIVKLLEHLGDSLRAPSLAGIVEDRQQMKERITMIAKFHKTDRGLALAVCLFTGLALVTLTDARSADKSPTSSAGALSVPPKIIATSPSVGATDVGPALSEITVTFDQDMGGGMSWTGGGPDFPPTREGQKAQWRNKRTCALPVKLNSAHYYRVGINSKNYQNFANQRGVAALPSAIFFTTQGASEQLKARTLVPKVVRCDPDNGAQNVSPAVTELRVTFDAAMAGGCSWCTAGDDDSDFPKGVEGKQVYWTEDKKTCVLPVALRPRMTYRLSLNAPGYINFQSEGGVPLEPVAYSFKTAHNP
jgi:beta-lactamase regulating signal transducer with metallopeptidase domain